MNPAFYIAIPMLGLALAGAAAGLGPTLFHQARTRAVLRNGVEATARVIALRDTGSRVNGQPVAAIQLQVTPGGGAPYEAQVQAVVTSLNAMQFVPGAVVRVKYDPDKPSSVAMVGP